MAAVPFANPLSPKIDQQNKKQLEGAGGSNASADQKDVKEANEFSEKPAGPITELALPDCLTCPLCLDPLTDPVLASDGFLYQRDAITAYFTAYNNRNANKPPEQKEPLVSPITRSVMPNMDLRKVERIKGGVEEFEILKQKIDPILSAAANASGAIISVKPEDTKNQMERDAYLAELANQLENIRHKHTSAEEAYKEYREKVIAEKRQKETEARLAAQKIRDELAAAQKELEQTKETLKQKDEHLRKTSESIVLAQLSVHKANNETTKANDEISKLKRALEDERRKANEELERMKTEIRTERQKTNEVLESLRTELANERNKLSGLQATIANSAKPAPEKMQPAEAVAVVILSSDDLLTQVREKPNKFEDRKIIDEERLRHLGNGQNQAGSHVASQNVSPAMTVTVVPQPSATPTQSVVNKPDEKIMAEDNWTIEQHQKHANFNKDADAMFQFGQIFEAGTKVRKNIEVAKIYYRQALEATWGRGQEGALARLFELELGIQGFDLKSRLSSISGVCIRGDCASNLVDLNHKYLEKTAVLSLETLIKDNTGEEKGILFYLFSRSFDHGGNEGTIYLMGIVFEKMGQCYAHKAVECYQKACRKFASAFLRLGACLENGIGCAKDPNAALKTYIEGIAFAENMRRNSFNFNSETLAILSELNFKAGECYRQGIGTLVDLTKANTYLDIAKSYGHPKVESEQSRTVTFAAPNAKHSNLSNGTNGISAVSNSAASVSSASVSAGSTVSSASITSTTITSASTPPAHLYWRP